MRNVLRKQGEFMAKERIRVFVDTCSLIHENSRYAFKQLVPAFTKEKNHFIIATRVLDELKRHVAEGDADLKRSATRGLQIVEMLQQQDLAELRGETDDPFPDALFQTLFMRNRLKFPQCLITQDKRLAFDILSLQHSYSIERQPIHPIQVWTIDGKSGTIRNWPLDEVRRRLFFRRGRPFSNTTPFLLRSQINEADDTKEISTSVKIGPNCQARGMKMGSIRLGELIARGGEGEVLATDIDNVVAKVYRADKLTEAKRAKLTLMVEHGIDCENPTAAGICWPLDLLYDVTGDFRGYLMARAFGSSLADCICVGGDLATKFPDWDRLHLVRLCQSILERISYLHGMNVLLGDINTGNIMISSPADVYFVDTDSYQVDGFPCTVGTVHFTAPELQGAKFRDVLRTRENEHFAVATLLFMVLHAGQSPYAQVGGGTPAENIRNGYFPYACGTRSTRVVPPGPWRFIWSNLPRKAKVAFYETFDASFANKRRRTVDEWVEILDGYAYVLEKHRQAGDVERQLFPEATKPESAYARERWKNGK